RWRPTPSSRPRAPRRGPSGSPRSGRRVARRVQRARRSRLHLDTWFARDAEERGQRGTLATRPVDAWPLHASDGADARHAAVAEARDVEGDVVADTDTLDAVVGECAGERLGVGERVDAHGPPSERLADPGLWIDEHGSRATLEHARAVKARRFQR